MEGPSGFGGAAVPGGQMGGFGGDAAAPGGQTGAGGDMFSGLTDQMTGAMVGHFAREFTQGSLSLWPQFVLSAKHYFNVTHGYVLRKVLWQLLPLPGEKPKSTDGEINAGEDWTRRVFQGLEVEIEVPDAYIPTMGFITYVVLYCLVQGLQEKFEPDMLSSTLTLCLVVLVLETTAAKAALYVAGSPDAPVVDLVVLFGYKYFHLSLQLLGGLVLGGGWRPTGMFYKLFSLYMVVSCGVALWQVLQRLPRFHPAASGQECKAELNQLVIKALPVLQALVYWWLLPSWAAQPALPAATVDTAPGITTTILKAAAVVATNGTGK